MKLKDAVGLYKKELGAPSNSYDWYRRSARRFKHISIGGHEVKAFKEGAEWHVDDVDFKLGIKSRKERLKQIEKNAENLEKGIITAKDGETVDVGWGTYTVHKGFRNVLSFYSAAKDKDLTGTWYCNTCNKQAETEHNGQECHLCSDWGGCGRDCTLSAVICKTCGNRITFRK